MTAMGPIAALLEREKREKSEIRVRQNSAVAAAVARRTSVQGERDTTPRASVSGSTAVQPRRSSSNPRVSVTGISPSLDALTRPTEASKIRKSIAEQEFKSVEQANARRQSMRQGPEALAAFVAQQEGSKDVEESEEQKQKWEKFHHRMSSFQESREKQLESIRKQQERKQIEGCTFEPHMHGKRRPPQIRSVPGNQYERGIEHEARKQERLERMRQEMLDKEMAQCSFQPQREETNRTPPRRRSVMSQGTTSTRASMSSVPGSAASGATPSYSRRNSGKPDGYSAMAGVAKPNFQPPPRRGSGYGGGYAVAGSGYHEDFDDQTQHGSDMVSQHDYEEEDEDCETLLPPGMEQYREQQAAPPPAQPQTLNELLAQQGCLRPEARVEDAHPSGASSQAAPASAAKENIKVLERLQNRRRLLQETLDTPDAPVRGGRTAGAGPSSGVPRPPAHHGTRQQVCSACGHELHPESKFCGKCGAKCADKVPMSSSSAPVAAAVERMEDMLLRHRDVDLDPDQEWQDDDSEEEAYCSEDEAFSEHFDPHVAEREASAEAPIFRGSILDASERRPGAGGAAAFARALGRPSQSRPEDVPALQFPRSHQRQ